MTLHLWGLYASAVLLLCLTPGPNSLLAVTNGARFGVSKTLFSTLGCAAGLTLLIGASLSGLSLILAASETVFYIIKWLGACYLIYLGVTLIRMRGAFTIAYPPVNPCSSQRRSKMRFVVCRCLRCTPGVGRS